MRIALVAALVAITAGSNANALSCIPPDVARTYSEVDASEDRYTLVVGKITFDKKKLPKTDWEKQSETPAETIIQGRLSGRSIQADGFTGQWSRNISIKALCYGPWCTGAPSQEDMLVFVNLDDSPPSVTLTPCGGYVFPATDETLRRALRCHAGGPCKSDPTY